MFNPFGALTATARGGVQGYTEDAPLIFEQMGLAALGRAFQPDQGPLPPMPGQASVPAPPMRSAAPAGPVGPMADANAPASFSDRFDQWESTVSPSGRLAAWQPEQRDIPSNATPAIGATPGASPGAGAPPVGPGSPSFSAGPAGGPPGMPQLDLRTLSARIMAKNPDLPPQAMMAALMRAEPLLNAQGRLELARLGVQQRERAMQERERHNRAIEEQRGATGQPGQTAGLMTPDAIEAAAERYIKTGQMPPNLGRGVQGRADLAAIQNRAAELAKERNIKPADLTKNWQTFKAEQIAIQRFMSGPQGNTVRSLGVVVDHLDTMRELAIALNNNDIQAINRIANAWAEQTGQPAPTNAATAAQIVGAEVIKSLGIAGAGTKEERQEAANAFARAKSPQQLIEAIDKVVKPLMLGQLKGLRRQFKTSTGLGTEKFDELLGEQAQTFFGEGGGGKGGAEQGFDREAAKKAGYTDEEIDRFLKGK